MTEGKVLATHRQAQEINVPVYSPAGHVLSCPEQLLEIQYTVTLHILDCPAYAVSRGAASAAGSGSGNLFLRGYKKGNFGGGRGK